MSKVQQFPKPSNGRKAEITQDELKHFYGLAQKYSDARNAYIAEQAKIILRMNAGSGQEPGRYHVDRKIIHRRRISYKEIVIDLKGPKWVQQKLEETKPTISYKLEFADIGSQTNRRR